MFEEGRRCYDMESNGAVCEDGSLVESARQEQYQTPQRFYQKLDTSDIGQVEILGEIKR